MKINYILKEAWLLLLLPLLDVVSTFLFVRKFGIEAELNPIARFLMSNFSYFGYFVMYVLAASIFILLIFVVNKISVIRYEKNVKTRRIFTFYESYNTYCLGIFFGVYAMLYIIVLINNLSWVNIF